MAERKLLGMRLPHFVYPTLELDPDPHVENFLRPTLFFWNPAEQLRSDILCPKCDSKMRPDTERSWEQHAFRVYGNDELVLVWSYNYVCGSSMFVYLLIISSLVHCLSSPHSFFKLIIAGPKPKCFVDKARRSLCLK